MVECCDAAMASPWPCLSLELAKRLSTRNFHVYLCSTPINLAPFKKRITHKYSHSIQLIEFHIPSQPDLPPHFHTTNGLPLHLQPTLKRAMDMASPSFIEIIRTLKPDIIIYDFNQEWETMAASWLRIPAVQFFSTNASVLCYFLHRSLKQGVDFPYPEINIRGTHWNRKIHDIIEQSRNDDQGRSRENAAPVSRRCDIVFMKTFGEMEEKYIKYGSELFRRKIVPTGPLVQDQEEDTEDNSEIMEWLNKKEASSTVFVSFGTESYLSREETGEIAKGLELSMVNFIWVLRFSFEEKISIGEALPNGFLESVGDKGLVVEKLAPQGRILRHPNIGGFVSHCGWGSIMEAMSFGVPIVAIPMNFDQPFNARLVEEMGVGLEVGRDEYGRFGGGEIAELIREVVVGENGKKVRDKAREMREKIKSKGEEDIDEMWKNCESFTVITLLLKARTDLLKVQNFTKFYHNLLIFYHFSFTPIIIWRELRKVVHDYDLQEKQLMP